MVKGVPDLKEVATSAVIAIHTADCSQSINPSNPLGVGGNAADNFGPFALPLFVFVSGLVLALTYAGSFSKMSFHKKRAAVIPAYLISSTPFLAYDLWPFSAAPSWRWVAYSLRVT